MTDEKKESKKTISMNAANSAAFHSAIKKITDKAEFDVKKAFKFHKYLKYLNQELEIYKKVVQKFIDDCAKRDEDGNVLQSEEGHLMFDLTNKDVQQKNKELNEFSCDVWFEMSMQDIESVKLTVAEIDAVEPLISDLDTTDEDEQKD